MKYLRQFCVIMLVTFLGEILYMLLPLPVPASIYGLVLMLAALCTKVIKPEQVKETAVFLIEIMPVMFIPASVGLIESWDSLQGILLPVAVTILVTTVLVFAVTGLVSQGVIRKSNRKSTKGGSDS